MKQLCLLLLSLFIFSNCAFTQSEETFPPDWVSNPPKSKHTLYAVGFGQSRNETVAIDKSRLNAFAEMAMLVGPTEVSSKEEKKSTKKESHEKENKANVDITLTDITIEKKAIEQDEDNIFNAYMLISYKPKTKRWIKKQ
ncbi:MAG: LPP20 family lipoprotein [Salinivirgaceae bacterium]|nr:LPP20 family lipoprotein [Salinivirgaceae bacterium]